MATRRRCCGVLVLWRRLCRRYGGVRHHSIPRCRRALVGCQNDLGLVQRRHGFLLIVQAVRSLLGQAFGVHVLQWAIVGLLRRAMCAVAVFLLVLWVSLV